jgi:transcriptional regulator with XRE-family HTH domain
MDDLPRRLAATFRALLTLREIPQSELAKRAKMSASQVNKYLRGETVPDLPQVERLARGLDVDLYTVFFTLARIDEIERRLEAGVQAGDLAEKADVILLREGGLLIKHSMGGLVAEMNRLLFYIEELEMALGKRRRDPNRS